MCLAGAWRDWPASWDPINKFIVEPLQDVDIYAISDTVRSGQHGKADPGWTVARMKSTFGTHFKAGERLGPAQLKNVSGESWPEIAAAQAALGSQGATVFSYLYKIWRCGQLIHKSGINTMPLFACVQTCGRCKNFGWRACQQQMRLSCKSAAGASALAHVQWSLMPTPTFVATTGSLLAHQRR